VRNSLGPGLDYSVNLFEISLSLGPVSRHIIHVAIRFGFGELILEFLLLRPCELDMVSAELNTAEFGVCPVVAQIPRNTEVGGDECTMNIDQWRGRKT